MPGIKELKNRIKSVKSTRKITRAMQMVSASKMRKAQVAAMQSRKYSEIALQLIGNLKSSLPGGQDEDNATEADSTEDEEIKTNLLYTDRELLAKSKTREMMPLLVSYPQATKTGVIIISTNKGLVGSLNTNLLNKLKTIDDPEVITELFVMGKKAQEHMSRLKKNMIADFPKNDTWVPIESIYPVAKMVTELYKTGEYKQILIVYNHFVSTLVQKATIKQLLPFEITKEVKAGAQAVDESSDYIFEPSPDSIITHLIPRIIESQIYQAVLESDASEHSARMIMMKNATEAAGDLISDYTLTYNQLRQNKITTELAEITAGKIALE